MAVSKLITARETISWALALSLAITMVFCARPAVAQSIGTAAAVTNQVQGIHGGATRTLATGGSVFSEDTVKTGDASLAQLLFVDQTTFTVAANSQALLSHVFHGKQGVGALVMHAVVGAFRFVSGVQTPSNYQIQFPQGYITVRGTIVDLIAAAERTMIVVDEGAVTVGVNRTRASYDLVAGNMLVVYADGRADGPTTMDATIMQIIGTVPFPLFGSTINPTQQQIDQFDSRKDLNDILNVTGGRPTPSPPPPPPPCCQQ
jgi:hypothetical protein